MLVADLLNNIVNQKNRNPLNNLIMKKLILLLAFVSILYSCSNGGNASSSNNNGNSSNGNVDYYFKIKINGVEHKVQGNTSGFSIGNINSYQNNPNECRAVVGTTTQLFFIIADITKSNYVSGQNLLLYLHIPNCHVGLNQAIVTISSPVLDAFTSSSGGSSYYWVENSGLYCTTTFCQGYPLLSTYNQKITLNITDMGTPTQYNPVNPSVNYYNYGNTFKGSFNGPIYFQTGPIGGAGSVNFNIPMQLSMEFEAYRIN
jgi:hypothetical protein